jgi:very-short-patch-repair endonuclease/predicted transcriptional regulator of viral defense system
VRVARTAGRQHGCIRTDQLAACGLDHAAIARRVAKGHLHRVHYGVYAVGHAALTLDARFMAAVLAGGPRAVLSHWAACALAGLIRSDDRRPIDVTVPTSRARPGIRFHRARALDPRDTTRIRGIPTTTPARAILEIAPRLTDTRLKRLVRQAQAEKLANTRRFAATIARANGHRATTRLAALIEKGPAPTRSSHEDIVLDLILNAGFEHPHVNQQLPGSTYVPDLRWPAQRLILEVDSPWHDGRLAQELDATRQADLEAAGERVLRTTLQQATTNPSQLLARIHQAGAPYTDPQR